MTTQRIVHHEPEFLTAHALLVALEDYTTPHLPVLAMSFVSMARVEFTGLEVVHVPAKWLELDPIHDGREALTRLDANLGQLIADATDLDDSLRIIRTRDCIREAITEAEAAA